MEIAKQCQIALQSAKIAIEISFQKDIMYKAFWDTFNAKFSSSEQNNESQSVVMPTYLLEIGGNMKGITIRKDGRLEIRHKVNGKTFREYARTYGEAIKLNKKILRKVEIEKRLNPRPKIKRTRNGITVNKFYEKWIEVYKKPFVNDDTYRGIKSYMNNVLIKLGQYELKQLTAMQLQEFMNAFPRSRKKEKIGIYLSSMLDKAVELDIINKNPFKAVIKDKKVKTKNYMFSFAEQQKILQAIKGTDIEHEVMIYLMVGCRPNELPTKECFDFENKFVHIFGTKNDNARHRVVEMSDRFAEYMKEYLASNEIQKEIYVSRKFTEICNSLEIEKPSLYRLRHTFASNHFTLGTQAKQVQVWLGHSEIGMTLDTYTDIDRTSSKEKIQNLYNNFYYIKN